jgi:hypothetical protein
MPEGSQTTAGSQNRKEEDFYDQGLAPGNDRRSEGIRPVAAATIISPGIITD